MSDPTPRPGGPRQYGNAMRSQAPGHGKISTLCALGCLAMAGVRRDAFPGGNPWQDFAVVRSRVAICGNFFAPCIPEGAPDGKIISSRQDLRAMYPKRAGFGRICAPCIRKAPQIAFPEYTARRSCQEGALFAALTPRIMHSTQILPSGVDEPPWHSQPLCRRTARAAHNHGAALMARQPSERAARTLATSAPPNGAKPPATATPKRNPKANGMDWLHYVERFCENRESEKESARAKMPTFWQKRTLKEKTEPQSTH